MLKRGFSFILCICLTLSIVLSGCGNKTDETSTDKGTKTESETKVDDKNNEDTAEIKAVELSAPGEFPIVKDKLTLNFLIQADPAVEDFSTNEFTKWYEDKTNLHIEFDLLPAKSGQEKLNLILASGSYPDAYVGCPFDMTQIMNYGSQGLFHPLNDIIEEQGVESQKIFKDDETAYVKDILTFPDGNIYSMPAINQCYHCSMCQKMWIYKPWLDKLGLDMPQTTEQFYEVLKAFKNNDPNGNNKADEIPLSACKEYGSWFSDIDGFLMNAFVYSDPYKRVFLEDGKVQTSFTTEGWKKGLKYLRKLYSEGLLYAETFTQDGDQLQQLGENPGEIILGAAPGGHMGCLTQMYGESGRWLDYVTVPALEGPDGVRTTYFSPFGVGVHAMIISSTCEYPEVCVKWADGLYETESTLRSVFGRPEKEWRWAEDGEVGLNGKQALYKNLQTWSETVQNNCWIQTGPSLRTSTFRLGQVAKEDEPLETILYESTKNDYEPYRPDVSQVMPPLAFTADQSSEMADIKKTILDYVEEMLARFVTGDVDIDDYWDTYLQELENMNLKRFVELYQTAYDDKYK